MKLKTFLIAIMAIFFTASAYARDTYSHDVNVLPQTAQTFIKTHFPNLEVSHIKIDHHTFGGDDYDVVLTDGTEIDFDSKGNLEDIDCGRNGRVPDAIINVSVRDYVSRTYPNQRIIKYDVKKNGFEVELQSGLDLEFNKSGRFLRVDD